MESRAVIALSGLSETKAAMRDRRSSWRECVQELRNKQDMKIRMVRNVMQGMLCV